MKVVFVLLRQIVGEKVGELGATLVFPKIGFKKTESVTPLLLSIKFRYNYFKLKNLALSSAEQTPTFKKYFPAAPHPLARSTG